MCGIIAIKKYQNASKSLLKRYHKQRARGCEGFGFVSVDNGLVKDYRRYQDEKETLARIKTLAEPFILFHHRFPTSTANISEASHPIIVDNKELPFVFYLAHNGIIANADEMKKKHLKLGYNYTTDQKIVNQIITAHNTYTVGTPKIEFNDSEALAIELARYLAGKTATIEAEGSVAFVGLVVSREGQLLKTVWGRNIGSPLTIANNKEMFVLASEGEADVVKPNMLFSLEESTAKITSTPIELPQYVHKNSLGFKTYDNWGTSLNWNSQLNKNEEDIEELELSLEELSYEYEEMQKNKMITEANAVRRKIGSLELKLADLYAQI